MDQNRVLSEKVYGVEKNEIIKNKRIEDTDYIALDIVDTNKDIIGNETKPKGNSMQAMAVAEIKDEYKTEKRLEKVPGYPESVIKKDITIAYAGTKEWQDWKTNVREIFVNDKHVNGAFQSALEYANEIERKYSVKNGFTIATTGHSLGGAEATYVAALKNFNGITYGAAGAGLSEKEIKNYKGQIINIYDTSDIVTRALLTGGQEKIPFLSFGIDNAGWDGFGHDLSQFKLDKKGNYIDKYGDIAVYSDLSGGIDIEQTQLAQQIIKNKKRLRDLEANRLDGELDTDSEIKRLKEENKGLQRQINELFKLNELQALFMASGGGLSSNEQIYLDDSKALAVIKLASSNFEGAMEETLKIYQNGINEFEELWHNGLATMYRLAPDLSEVELMETMEKSGCTKQKMVDIPTEELREKIVKVNQMKAKFDCLAKEITLKIDELKQRDVELAQQLKGIG